AGYSRNFGNLLVNRLASGDRGDLVPIDEIVERPALAARYIEAFAKSGVIEKITIDNRDYLDPLDTQILAIWVEARSGAFEEALGFGPHGILPFHRAMEDLAETVTAHFIDQIESKLDEAAAVQLAQIGIEVS